MVVLQVDACLLVVGDVDLLGCSSPGRRLVVAQPGPLHQLSVVRRPTPPAARSTQSAAARRFWAAITLVKRLLSTTVEYSSGPVTLWITKLAAVAVGEEPEIRPHPGRLHEQFDAVPEQQLGVTGDV